MTAAFEELDFVTTPLGDLSLRRRAEPRLGGREIHEVKLDDEFLMSSLFTEGEIQLARLGLGILKDRELDIVVGGLGLGYTAAAVLDDPRVRSLGVVELLQPVIEWHRRGLVPLGTRLADDPRCRLVPGDFFRLAMAPGGFSGGDREQQLHAVLLDIDHSPRHWLHRNHRDFYTRSGMENLARHIRPGGIFGVWSNETPDGEFLELLRGEFRETRAHEVCFRNPYTGGESRNTVYIAVRGQERPGDAVWHPD